MSGLSTSITLCLDSNAEAVARALSAGDTAVLDQHLEHGLLITSSRNNYLEYSVSRLIAHFNVGSLGHLTRNFKSGRPAQGWSATALHDPRPIGQSLRHLLTLLREKSSETIATLDNVHISEQEWAMLQDQPRSISEAVARFDDARARNEGDDPATIFAFLQAHLVLIEHAASNADACVYACYMY